MRRVVQALGMASKWRPTRLPSARNGRQVVHWCAHYSSAIMDPTSKKPSISFQYNSLDIELTLFLRPVVSSALNTLSHSYF
jgi:hypothetical protein